MALLVGDQFQAVSNLPTFALILLVCLMITFLTELTSNTATTEMILPILAAIAVATETHPLILMIPATLSASCAFMPIRESLALGVKTINLDCVISRRSITRLTQNAEPKTQNL